jgi:hypothetical protein
MGTIKRAQHRPASKFSTKDRQEMECTGSKEGRFAPELSRLTNSQLRSRLPKFRMLVLRAGNTSVIESST